MMCINFIRVNNPHIMNARHTVFKVPSSSESQGQTLQDLKTTLTLNRRAQDRLKQARDAILQRMKDIDQFISTSKLNAECPPATSILSYIKFQRNLPTSYKQQLKLIESNSGEKTKPNHQEDQFMKKLSQAKGQTKKRQLDVQSLPNNPKQIDFSRIWLQSQFNNGIMVYRAWFNAKNKSANKTKQLFTCDEDKTIIQKYKMYGQNWQKICSLLPNRTYDDIYYQFHNRINPKLQPGRWNIRQTLMLIILVQQYGAGKWVLISQKMGIKSELQVRERYFNFVDPSIGKEVWTYQLEKKLLQIVEDYGYCWKKMSALPIFKNKTDNSLWRKFKTLMIRFSEQEIREILPPNKNNRGLGEKIIRQKKIVEGRKRSAKNRPQPPIYFNQFKPKSGQTQDKHKAIQKGKQDIQMNATGQRSQYFEQLSESNQFLVGEKDCSD